MEVIRVLSTEQMVTLKLLWKRHRRQGNCYAEGTEREMKKTLKADPI